MNKDTIKFQLNEIISSIELICVKFEFFLLLIVKNL
jgi:hypothetical protein